jgi:drug/metabolite transporter (DMT)-like permease
VTPTALALVLLSAVTHAFWNFLLKKHAGGEVFIGLSKLVEATLFFPVFLIIALPGMPRTAFVAVLVGVAAAGVATNYVCLSLAYRHGDLTLTYPVQRGATLLFLPILAALTIGERVDARGATGLLAILAGVLVLQLPSLRLASVLGLATHLRNRAVGFALLVALTNAVFTLWDKFALRTLAPFTYMYLYTAIVAALYALWIARRHPGAAVAAEWRAHRWPIVAVGVLNTVSYLLALAALKSGVSSYAIGFRQLSIAVGVLLGWRLLGESLGPPRRTGIALILAGCLLIAFAR